MSEYARIAAGVADAERTMEQKMLPGGLRYKIGQVSVAAFRYDEELDDLVFSHWTMAEFPVHVH